MYPRHNDAYDWLKSACPQCGRSINQRDQLCNDTKHARVFTYLATSPDVIGLLPESRRDRLLVCVLEAACFANNLSVARAVIPYCRMGGFTSITNPTSLYIDDAMSAYLSQFDIGMYESHGTSIHG